MVFWLAGYQTLIQCIHDITLEWYGLSVVQDTTVFSWDCCEDFCLQRFPKKNQTLLNLFQTSVQKEGRVQLSLFTDLSFFVAVFDASRSFIHWLCFSRSTLTFEAVSSLFSPVLLSDFVLSFFTCNDILSLSLTVVTNNCAILFSRIN